MYSKIYSAQASVNNPFIVEIELNFDQNKGPQISIVGLPDKAVDESKDRVSSAIDNSVFEKDTEFKTLKNVYAKTTISLAPATRPKNGALFDLPIALGYLHVTQELDSIPGNYLFIGELGLDGSLKPVNGVLTMARLAKEKGFKAIIVPKSNSKEAALIDGIEVYGFESLSEVIDFLRGAKVFPVKHTKMFHKKHLPSILLDDIKGQTLAKRALTIAAAGGHNIAFYGPPGTGKSMLSKVFVELLPNLSPEEGLEVTSIHSAAGVLRETVISRPPLRAPHHSASYVSVIGGGAKINPGEITLAHRGVLFLDEFPEFDKRVINTLREPLEEKIITVSRATGSVTFPADFILIVAMNPCPCGFYGTNKCTCSASAIQRYQNKISGPIADRIDIWVEVSKIEYEKLLENTKRVATEHNQSIKKIKTARDIQKQRFSNNLLNSKMSVPALNKHINLDASLKDLLNNAARKMELSGRAYHKVLKVARTIADLEASNDIKDEHILEALNYREKLV